jgi:hypothetical protein
LEKSVAKELGDKECKETIRRETAPPTARLAELQQTNSIF